MRMPTRLVALVLTALWLAAPAFGEVEESPYAAWTGRSIKALSAERIADYFEGRGMGFALAAELNRFPGPKHVLEMAAELELTGEQVEATREIFDTMAREARELGREIVEAEAELDRSFANGSIDEASLARQVDEIAALEGRLRRAHLGAHLRMVKVLDPAQIERYVELRGYGGDHSGHEGHEGHGGHGGPDSGDAGR